MFIHELPDVEALFRVVANENGVLPYLVEKDYWIMHALWGLRQQGFVFDLKGGTSLSKGYKILHRFSEDIDIKIYPDDDTVKTGKHHDKPAHIESRANYFDSLAQKIDIPGMKATREHVYDDSKMRNAGIILEYKNMFPHTEGVKPGILLEAGFDQTEPNEKLDISSWVYDKVKEAGENIQDNLAVEIPCYLPEYTFVEKLQTLSTKVRKQQASGAFGKNFLRHFYDVYVLLSQKRVIDFLGTEDYFTHKKKRFRTADESNINENLAFNLEKDEALFSLYSNEYNKIKPLFIGEFVSFDEIYNTIIEYRDQM